jgi:hypothetical protein
MPPLAILLLAIFVALLLFWGTRSLPTTASVIDADAPPEDRLAAQGLGIFAVMVIAMGAVVVLAAQAGSVGDVFVSKAMAF